jgi:small subunit ribosomal protein S8
MLTRIRNAQAVNYKTVDLPYSKIKFDLAEILNQEGFVGSVSKKGRGNQRELEIKLKYKDDKGRTPHIQGLKRISKPGQRIYIGKKDWIQFSKEQGIVILSTSQGLMTLKDAKKKRLGGEVLCKIW